MSKGIAANDQCYSWVEVKVDGPGGKWTVQVGESGRSWVKVDGPKGHKVDGPRKWTVQNTKVDEE